MTSDPALILLHGARGAVPQMQPLAGALRQYGRAVPLNLLGHGGRPVPQRFTVHDMAMDVITQMDERGIGKAFVFGYSFGGYIALYLARHAPHRVLGVCPLATKVVFGAHAVALFGHLSRVERIRLPGNPQKEEMDRLHPGQDWNRIVTGLADLYRRLGEAPELTERDARAIAVPALIISASNDQIVPWAEALRLAYLIPRGQGFTFAGKAHPLSVIPLPFLSSVIGVWMQFVWHQQGLPRDPAHPATNDDRPTTSD